MGIDEKRMPENIMSVSQKILMYQAKIGNCSFVHTQLIKVYLNVWTFDLLDIRDKPLNSGNIK